MDDQELVRKCIRRDNNAREELFRRYSPRLLALCLRYTHSRAEADDLLQDAFIKIFDRIGLFRWQGEGSLMRWMSRLTLNLFFDRKRRKRLQSEVDIGPLEESLTDEPDYEETLQVPPEKLKSMIQGLPDRYRTVFQLYCIDHLSHREIGRMLGIKEKSSSADLSRAKSLLAKQIKQYLHEN